jgi:hypothetical protein
LSEVDAIQAFVEGGGGLLMFGLGWSYPNAITNYPLNIMGQRFGVFWSRGTVEDPTDNFGAAGYPRFHTLYPGVRLFNAEGALAEILAAHTAHPDDLASALQTNTSLRGTYLRAHLLLAVLAAELPTENPTVTNINEFCRRLIADQAGVAGFAYFRKSRTYDPMTNSVMAFVRERFYHTWKDAAEQTAAGRSQITVLGDFPQAHREIFVENGVYLMDNTALDSEQLGFIRSLLQTVPANLHNLSAVSIFELLGDQRQPWPYLPAEMTAGEFFQGKASAINISAAKLTGGPMQNQFPEDVPPVPVPIFTSVLTHELNHVVDSCTIDGSATLSARRTALLQSAGNDPLNYLRSMVPAGAFVVSPQEFLASLANEWFADSHQTLRLGLQQFDAGRTNPVNQALFFAEVYSQGGGTTWFYRSGPSGDLQCTGVPLKRDPHGHLRALRVAHVEYTFDLDADGNVTAWHQTPLLTISLLTTNAVVLSFPQMASNYFLQYQPELGGASNWISLAAIPTATNEVAQLTNIITTSGFFRLYKP